MGVAARNGTVTLSGLIDSYSGKLGAERAAKRVHGVRTVASDRDPVVSRLEDGRVGRDVLTAHEGDADISVTGRENRCGSET